MGNCVPFGFRESEDKMKKFMEFLVGRMLFPRIVRRIVEDTITNTIHPDFGWIWNEGEMGFKALKDAERAAHERCLALVRSSLRNYPSGPLDVIVLQEVRRLIQEGRNV